MPCNCGKRPNKALTNGLPINNSAPNTRDRGVTLTSPHTGKHFQLYPNLKQSRTSGLIRKGDPKRREKDDKRKRHKDKKDKKKDKKNKKHKKDKKDKKDKKHKKK